MNEDGESPHGVSEGDTSKEESPPQSEVQSDAQPDKELPDESSTAPTLEELQAELESVRNALAQAEESQRAAEDERLRALADRDNVQKRADRTISNSRRLALASFAETLLPVVDNFERALEAAHDDDPFVEGVKLSLRSFVDVLDKAGIRAIDPHGEPFDPNRHTAITTVENADMEPNSVVQVIRKGYLLHDERLLRAAEVIVSKAPAEQSTGSDLNSTESPQP